jgi:hypothetical protein
MSAQERDIVPEDLRFLRRFQRHPRSGPCHPDRIALLALAVNVYSGEMTPEEAYDRWLKKVRSRARWNPRRRA